MMTEEEDSSSNHASSSNGESVDFSSLTVLENGELDWRWFIQETVDGNGTRLYSLRPFEIKDIFDFVFLKTDNNDWVKCRYCKRDYNGYSNGYTHMIGSHTPVLVLKHKIEFVYQELFTKPSKLKWSCNVCKAEFYDRRMVVMQEITARTHIMDEHPAELAKVVSTVIGEYVELKEATETYERNLTDRGVLPVSTDDDDNVEQAVDDQQFPCDSCDATFTRGYELFEHHRTQHKPVHKCEYCEWEFPCRSQLNNHRCRSKNKPPTGCAPKIKICCPKCNNLYSRHAISPHMRSCVGNKKYAKNRRRCTRCDVYVATSKMGLHLLVCEADKKGSVPKEPVTAVSKRVVCPLCGEVFCTEPLLKSHLVSKHLGRNSKVGNNNSNNTVVVAAGQQPATDLMSSEVAVAVPSSVGIAVIKEEGPSD